MDFNDINNGTQNNEQGNSYTPTEPYTPSEPYAPSYQQPAEPAQQPAQPAAEQPTYQQPVQPAAEQQPAQPQQPDFIDRFYEQRREAQQSYNQTPPYTQPYDYVPAVEMYSGEQKKSKGLSIAAMVCGIVSGVTVLACCCFFVGAPFTALTGLAAVILGIIALVKKSDGRGMAITGLVLGIIGLLCGIIASAYIAVIGSLDSREDFYELFGKFGLTEEQIDDILDENGITFDEDGNIIVDYEDGEEYEFDFDENTFDESNDNA